MQRVVDRWYHQSSLNLQGSHSKFISQLRQLQECLGGDDALTPHGAVDAMVTPLRNVYPPEDGFGVSPAMASPPVSRAQLNYDSLLDEVVQKNAASRQLNPDEEVERQKLPDSDSADAPTTPPDDCNGSCQVLVQFKRNRTLQYESPYYVIPGEYVVVGGDRGEDVGLVAHSWIGNDPQLPGEARDMGVGKVLRIASVLEITQLQGVQTELETRAVEVAQEKVQEHGLPMRIVDAEYQFDRRKLTFYYQSTHRLDFRTLVRDLYKTFRARIWMEQDTSA